MAVQNIINQGQSCCMDKRNIVDNLITVRNLVAYYNIKHNEKASLINIDFKKAFDMMSHDYLLHVLRKISIPDKITKVIMNLNKNATSRLQINGNLSEYIKIERSVRQGCPLSMILFVIGLDPLLEELENKLEGQNIITKNVKILAYADDVTLIVKSNSEEIKSLEIIKSYCKSSGAEINEQKSTFLSLGMRWVRDSESNIPETPKIKYLGMIISKI
ncbi:uncharacterized protein LOC113375039 [Ctenocephalides felis]|uniref:uncharacterized protein LOC113375039 n=1 Tax=Ctenocephalides felis TaxID=7515 RepID=UPI000E6E4D78|nr:uncharacterized protein LOC113375039 [Ctenocephalides felis]